jgi:hypothetical protein
VNVHAKSRLILEPLRTLRSEDKGQARACPERTRAIPCTVRVGLLPDGLRRVDSNGDSNSSGKRQRPATAHNAQRTTLARSVATWDMSGLKSGRSPCNLRAINQGHEGALTATDGLRSRLLRGLIGRDLFDSQADSAGSIPVTRSIS